MKNLGAFLVGAILAGLAHAITPTHAISNGAVSAGMDCSRYGCSITSLRLRGSEFVNNYDRGRQGQIALQLDGYGECWNPTEAGSRHDASGPTSSSYPLAAWANQTIMASAVRAAYWSVDGFGVCPKGPHPRATTARVVSDTIIRKQVQAGIPGFPQVLRIDVEIDAEDTRRQVEIFTVYTPPDLGRIFRVDPAGNLYQPLWAPLEWHTPMDFSAEGSKADVAIAASHDHKRAIAIVRPAGTFLPCEAGARQYFGGHFAWGGHDTFAAGTTKLAVAAAAPPACGARLNYVVFVLVGDLTQVRNMVVALRN